MEVNVPQKIAAEIKPQVVGKEGDPLSLGLAVGYQVSVLRGSFCGRVGKIVRLPDGTGADGSSWLVAGTMEACARS